MGVCLYWHKRLDRDPANIWLRGHIERALDLEEHFPPPAVKRTDAGDWSI